MKRAIAALAAILFSAACSSPNQQDGAIPLKVVVTPRLTYAPLFIAKEDGYFERHGLNVELVEMTRSVDAIAALGQGRIDVAAGSINAGLLNAIARGVPIRIVADKGSGVPENCTANAVVGRVPWTPDLIKDRTNPLRASVDPTQFTGYMLERHLATVGASLEQVAIVDVAEPVEMQALREGQIDAVSAGEPWLSQILETGSGYLWAPVEKLIPNAQVGSVWFGPTLLEQNRDAGRQFVAAYLEAVRQYAEGPTARNLAIVSKFTGFDVSRLKSMCWPAIRPDGQVNIESIQEFATWLTARGDLEPNAPPAAAFVDQSFTQWASERAAR